MRFLPSIVFIAVLVVILFLADRAQIRSLANDRKAAADSVLVGVQSQFDDFVSKAIRSARRIVAGIDPSSEMDQESFGALVESAFLGSANLERAEYAPGFVTRLVHPRDNNIDVIGSSVIPATAGGMPNLARASAQGFPALAGVSVDEQGNAELQTQAEIRRPAENSIVSVGLVRLTVTFSLSVENANDAGAGSDWDLLVLSQPAGSEPPAIPAGWREQANFAPQTYVMRYPPGDFLLFLRPANGWRPSAADMSAHRLRLAGLALLLLLPVVLANWFALARASTQSSLDESQEKMAGVLRSLPGAALTITMPPGSDAPGQDDEIRFLNPEVCREIWGFDADVLEQDALKFWMTLATPEEGKRLRSAVAESVRTLTPIDQTWQITTPDGDTKWLLGRGNPVRLADGSTRWSVLMFDITANVDRQTELEHQREIVFRAQKNESIGHLTGGVAHDFNNLLAVILGNLELLADEETNPDRSEIIQAAITATLRGAGLTRSMLAFAGRARLSPEKLCLNDVVEESRTWIQRTLPKTVTVQMSLSGALWDIFADRSSTESAILNLILNARDAMNGKGVLTIETENVSVDGELAAPELDDATPGRYVRLSVSDTGSGISEKNLQDIFEPFFTTKRTGEGSGLGLSMVFGFIQQTGGMVKVDTEPGKGTTFRLYFPALEQGDFLPEPEKMMRLARMTGQGRRILLVEDEADVRDVIARSLESGGYQVVRAESGDAARTLLETDAAFDLLVTDIVMPGVLQGPYLADHVREHHSDIPVIFISGYAEDAKIFAAGVGAGDVRLVKPVPREELLSAVARAIGDPAAT